LAILRDDTAFFLSPKIEVRESIMGGSASPKTMLAIAEDADIRGQAGCQRVEDNAFHLGYFAR
jgi:hypothetical protein